MYPLGMTRSLAIVVGAAVLALPSTASGAELTVSPQKRCYSSGESVNLLGSGFTPLSSATVARDGSTLGALNTDGNGAYNGILTVAQNSGRQTKTYTATRWPLSPCVWRSALSVLAAMPTTTTSAASDPSACT